MTVLVTGGAGYIGSVTVERLVDDGRRVVVLDDLSRGHRGAVPNGVPLVVGQVGDTRLVRQVVDEHRVDACIHFAGLSVVSESVARPREYVDVNLGQGVALLNALADAGVGEIVVSSTAAVYGVPTAPRLSEDHPTAPTSPYGWSKLRLERALADHDRRRGLRFMALRYFNAAGATARHGEDHRPETHLIPSVLAAAERSGSLEVFGDAHPTPDGTAVRDYVHVEDLADAHVHALDRLRAGVGSQCLNLGTGRGHSVREVIDTAADVLGVSLHAVVQPPRPGDPPVLVADARRAADVLGWTPRHPALADMVRSAWRWRRDHAHGYAEQTDLVG